MLAVLTYKLRDKRLLKLGGIKQKAFMLRTFGA